MDEHLHGSKISSLCFLTFFHQNNLFFKGDEAIMSGLFFSVCEFSELMMVSLRKTKEEVIF